MLPIPKKTRPPKDPNAERLYPETDTLQLPPVTEAAARPKEQKEITYPLSRAHRKTGYPHVFGPVGVAQVPAYFIDRAKDIAEKLKSYHSRHEKTKHYYDSCAHYDPLDPDTIYNQGVYHSQFNEYPKTLEKMEQCLQINPRDYRALLLKADTYFRMCDFETALLCYSQGTNLKFPYRNWFFDGYYRTTAMLYDLTTGDLPMFYGGNMKVFNRIVQDQERSPRRMFNDTYKHYDDLYPLEPHLNGVDEEINVFHVSKPEPPNHVQRRIWKAAMQQLTGARKCLGAFYDCKVEIERHLIKQEHVLPRFGRANQTGKIERALLYLRGRIDKFEGICALMKSRQMRVNYDKPVDWLLEYGRWMADKHVKSAIPKVRKPAKLSESRYKWALSKTLFDIREKPMDICWIKKHGRQSRSNHLLVQRRRWKYMIGYKSARRGALAALRCGGDDWPFMKKLQRTVWDELEHHAPLKETIPIPTHIREIQEQIEKYRTIKDSLDNASKLIMPKRDIDPTSKLYYDPEAEQEEQWDENRELIKQTLFKRAKIPSVLPLPNESRPIPANLLEVFETKANEDVTAWDQRRKMSMELREILAKAEAVKAVAAAHEKHGLFGPRRRSKKVDKKKAKHSVSDEPDPDEDGGSAATAQPAARVPAAKSAAPAAADGAPAVEADPNALASVASAGSHAAEPTPKPLTPHPEDDEDPDHPAEQSQEPIRKARRAVERPRYDILNKRSVNEYLDKPRDKRRIPKIAGEDDEVVEVVQERLKTPEELEAERLLAARAEDPVEIARRTYDNQKADLIEKSYSVLMTCIKVSEFLEMELEIGNLMETTFPPANMRFPNGQPIILKGYPAPSETFTPMVLSEMFASRKKRKKKFDGAGKITAAEAAREADMVLRLTAEKGRRKSVLVAATMANLKKSLLTPPGTVAASADAPLPPPGETPTAQPEVDVAPVAAAGTPPEVLAEKPGDVRTGSLVPKVVTAEEAAVAATVETVGAEPGAIETTPVNVVEVQPEGLVEKPGDVRPGSLVPEVIKVEEAAVAATVEAVVPETVVVEAAPAVDAVAAPGESAAAPAEPAVHKMSDADE